MRELTLLETGYLGGLLLLSLVLPLIMSFYGPRDAVARRRCLRIVWMGQVSGAVAGLTVLASRSLAPYAAAFGILSCVGFAAALFREFRAGGGAEERL
jgi:hypothetical protein